ncbi:MAG: hypothetical protein ACRC2H_05120 [Silanimonas sp.]
MTSPTRQWLLLCALLLPAAAIADAADEPAATTPTCFPATAISALTVVNDHAVDVAADGRYFRVDLDPTCAGVKPGEAIQIASTSGPICADGRSAAVTASAICGVQAIRPTSSPADRCFRIRDVRGFALMRGEKVAITLRGGGKRIVQVDAACPQLDRLEEFDLVSGAADGRICGHPQDAIIGRPTAAVSEGMAKQFTVNDFRPCRIMSVEAPAPDDERR